ncbi:nucleotide kinase domain-containing protein [Parvibaculum sp.]|uniref:nucleotide kinase domain-containing protein n=1 Tax=Parvibaculum sp. TaxID=2024848 RepID=UPI003210D17E
MEITPVYDTYWRFAAERQAIYMRRLSDPVGPWTADPILAAYRFTNAYRASDRVSQFLIREVQYHEDRSQEPREVFFRTLLFKIFNRIDTWLALERELGPLTWGATDLDDMTRVLDTLMAKGQRLYSAAYIMPAPALGHARKHANHLALIKRMLDDRVPERIRQARSLRSVFETLLRYPGLGPFLAFQYTIDLNYSTLLDHDESDFVIAGPGALDGIAKCFTHTGHRSPEEVIYWVYEQQERAFADAGLAFQILFGRRLQPIDCQNLFCEISKYARVAHPEIKGLSGRTRIKQSFRRTLDPLPPPMFPPRWNLQVPKDAGQPAPHLPTGERISLFA